MTGLRWIDEGLVVLNATSVGAGRRNRFFLCMCSRNCIFDIIITITIIKIIFVVVVVMLQNRQVVGDSNFFWLLLV